MQLVYVTILAFIPAIFSYDEKYDKLDADKIVADKALFTSYIDCFLDRQPCTAEYATEFKELLPEVIREACAKCSEKQKKSLRKIVNALYEKRPDDAIKFQEKYDPKREYEADFAAFVAAE
ncbi:ejaculatory bulb-specific protein 3-like [Battus philenor]|uniref:ejaculatory bulb-specific protein 3-like n=1 Tax=Battus philenor TaxID=42288 RepID=UPI0035CFDB93